MRIGVMALGVVIVLSGVSETGAFACNTKCRLDLGNVEPDFKSVKNVDIASGWGGIKLLRANAEAMLMFVAMEQGNTPEFRNRAQSSIKQLASARDWFLLAKEFSKTAGAGHWFPGPEFAKYKDGLVKAGLPVSIVDSAAQGGTQGLMDECGKLATRLQGMTDKIASDSARPAVLEESRTLATAWADALRQAVAVGRSHDLLQGFRSQ